MCGRYKISKPVSKTIDIVKTNIKVEDSDNYNAHPSQKLPIIRSYTNGKALELCEFGYVNKSDLDKFEKNGSLLLGHPVINKKIGIEILSLSMSQS